MPRRTPIQDPTVPRTLRGSPVRAGAGFTAPGAPAPAITEPVDVVGALESVSRSLQVLFSDRIKAHHQAEEKRKQDRLETLGEDPTGVTKALEAGARSQFGKGFAELNEKQQAKISQKALSDLGLPDAGKQVDLYDLLGRRDAVRALAPLVSEIPLFANPEDPEGPAKFQKRSQELLAQGANPTLQGLEEYNSAFASAGGESVRASELQLAQLISANQTSALREEKVGLLFTGTDTLIGSLTVLRNPELAQEALGEDLPTLLKERSFGEAYEDEALDLLTLVDADGSDHEEKLVYLDNFEDFAKFPNGRYIARPGGSVKIIERVSALRRKYEKESETKAREDEQNRSVRINGLRERMTDAALIRLLTSRQEPSDQDLRAAAIRELNLLRSDEDKTIEEAVRDDQLFEGLNTRDLDAAVTRSVLAARQARADLARIEDSEDQLNARKFNRIFAEQGPGPAQEFINGLTPGSAARIDAQAVLSGANSRRAIQGYAPAKALTTKFSELATKAVTHLDADFLGQVGSLAEAYADAKATLAATELEPGTELDRISGLVAKFEGEYLRLEAEANTRLAEQAKFAAGTMTKAETDPDGALVALREGPPLHPDVEREVLSAITTTKGKQLNLISQIEQGVDATEADNLLGVPSFVGITDDQERALTQNDVKRAVVDFAVAEARKRLADGQRPEDVAAQRTALIRQAWDTVIPERFNGETPTSDVVAQQRKRFETQSSEVAAFIFGDPSGIADSVADADDLKRVYRVPTTDGIPDHLERIASDLAVVLGKNADTHEIQGRIGKAWVQARTPLERSAVAHLAKFIPGAASPTLENIRYVAEYGTIDETRDSFEKAAAIGVISKADAKRITDILPSAPGATKLRTTTLSDGTEVVVQSRPGAPIFGSSRIVVHLTTPWPDDLVLGPQIALDPTRTDLTDLEVVRRYRQRAGIPEDDTEAAKLLGVEPKEVPGRVLQLAGQQILFSQKLEE